MKKIEIDEETYEHLCRHTSEIGESASSILRRLLNLGPAPEDIYSHIRTTQPVSLVQSQLKSPSSKAVVDTVVVNKNEGDRVVGLLLKLSRLHTRQVVDRFMVILAWIYEQNPTRFECVQQVRGRTRLYFSRNKQEIENSGKSTFPVEIESTGWYVSTNNSTDTKRSILNEILRLLRFLDNERASVVQALEPNQEPTIVESPSFARPVDEGDDLMI